MFIGLPEYGIWTIGFTIVTYLNLGAFGITNVYVRYVAEYHAKNEINKINGLLSTGMILVTAISLIALIIFWFILNLLVEQVFRIPPKMHDLAAFLFFGTACLFAFQLSIGDTLMRMLNGLQKISETTTIFILGLLVEVVLTVIFLFSGFGIYGLFWAFTIRQLFSALAYLIISYQFIPELSISIKNFDRAYLKVFYRFGAIVQLAGMIGVFLNTLDKLITSTMLNMQATALLGLGARFPSMALSIPSSMSAVFLPATAYMHSQQRHQEMIDMYLQGSRLIGLATGFMMGFLAAFSAPLIVAWLGNQTEYQIAAVILTIYTLPQHLHVLTGPGSAFFKGIDNPANNLIYSFTRLGLTTACVIIGLKLFGITIITIATTLAVATTISALIYLASNNHRIGISQWTFFTKATLPGLVPYGIAYLLFWLLTLTPWLTKAMEQRWYAVGFILISGTIYTIITALVIYWGIYNEAERNRLQQLRHQGTEYLINKIRPNKR
jgi:O-antigen/teichoic acid export membrane protein